MASPACTLDPADRATRLREWQSLRSGALISESHSDDGSIAVFDARPEVMRRLTALIEAENDCCSHLRFKVTQGAERITVEVSSAANAP